MSVADKLCEELFKWLGQLDRCADRLVALAEELEELREAINTGQMVGNTAGVLGSIALVTAGITTLMTGGLGTPLLVVAGTVAAGAGAAVNLTLTLVEKWKSSDKMKAAERTIEETKKTEENIQRLKKKLTEECKSHGPELLTAEEVECEVTVSLLSAMARRSGRDVPLSRLRNLLRTDHMFRTSAGFSSSHTAFLTNVGVFLVMLGYSPIILTSFAGKAGKAIVPAFGGAVAKGMSSEFAQLAGLSLKTVLKGTGQVAGGVIGLVLTVPDLIENCDKLIKNEHETEASNYLRRKAKDIREDVKKLKSHLNEIQETLKELPEMECGISLAQEVLGGQVYTRGIVSMEYKQTRKQVMRPRKWSYILLSTKNMGTTQSDNVRKRKTDDKKNKRQKKTSSSTVRTSDQNISRTSQEREPPEQDDQSQQDRRAEPSGQYRLPRITMSNVRSLPNKMEELSELVENDEDFGNSDLMFFTESWLTRNSNNIHLSGFRSYRADRDAQQTYKSRGGGLIMFVNEDWATDVQVENIINTPDYELMVVTIIPHDHPLDAPPLTFIHVYVPGPDFGLAANDIAEFYYDALDNSNGGPVFLLGDFNQCDLSYVLGDLYQYVTCPTRINNTLDLCYGNVPDAYRSECRPPIGRADHNVIHLIPKDSKDKKDSKDDKCSHDHTRPREE